LCRFLRSARNDARRLPMALLSHTGGPNARAPEWAALVALGGHSRTEVRPFRSKKEYCRIADRQNPHYQHWPVILPKPQMCVRREPRPAMQLPIIRNNVPEPAALTLRQGGLDRKRLAHGEHVRSQTNLCAANRVII